MSLEDVMLLQKKDLFSFKSIANRCKPEDANRIKDKRGLCPSCVTLGLPHPARFDCRDAMVTLNAPSTYLMISLMLPQFRAPIEPSLPRVY